MKKYTIILLFALMQLSVWATPTIRFERTDVEGKSANFVTATYSFGIDIIIDSLEHCSNVSFELYHNQTRYVKFSEYYRSEDWLINDDWSQVITIIDKNSIDNASDKATIAIQAGTMSPADINSPNNPKIIHLEFVVAPSAINGGSLDFTIDKIKATYYKNVDNQIIDTLIPITFKVSYNIHSYVNVWPGDADCNGKVDTYDNAVISLYLNYPKNGSRSFKRQNTSILWQPQLCIAWDTLAATFADCDGNSIVTTSDYAVVYVNYDSLHNDFCKITPAVPPIENNLQLVSQNENISKIDVVFLEGNKVIPISISNYNEDIAGVAGIIDYSDLDVELEGIKAGNLFGDKVITHFYNNKDTKQASFCIAIDKNYLPELLGNNVAELYIKDNTNSVDNIAIIDFIAFNKFGKTKELYQTYTSIALEKEMDFFAKVLDGKLILSNADGIESIIVLNYFGSEVANFSANDQHIYSINNLPIGVYFVVGKLSDKIKTTKIINM